MSSSSSNNDCIEFVTSVSCDNALTLQTLFIRGVTVVDDCFNSSSSNRIPTCCGTVSRILHFTISNGTGLCGCLNGVHALTWNSAQLWEGTYTLCGKTLTFRVFSLDVVPPCQWSFDILCNGSVIAGQFDWFDACSPLSHQQNGITISQCACIGSIDVLVSET